MITWFLGMSLIGKLWVVYAALGALIFAGAIYMEVAHASKVNGAGGWMLFAATMLVGAFGLPLMLLLSGLIWLVQFVMSKY